MDKSISRFFDDIGMPLRNDRWSWGAQRGNVVVLRTWSDQYNVKTRRVAVLRMRTLLESASAGLDERVQHLKAIWDGGIAAYTVIATAEDPTAKKRSIESYRDDLFPIEAIEIGTDGTLLARCAKYVSPREFSRHADIHRTEAGEGTFPIDEALETGLSSASLHEKLPYIRTWLIDISRKRGTAEYAEVMNGYDLWYGTLFTALKLLGQTCVDAGEPVITSLVVDKDTGRCSNGFRDVFGILDDATERERCYTYWSDAQPETALTAPSDEEAVPSDQAVDGDNAVEQEERVARYMSVEIRQEQPAFRKAVFAAYDGRCAISGCDIPEALEAAHLCGHNWREGQNQATDGILLRRDLHTLYDRGLLDLSGGIARFSPRVVHHYGHLEGHVIAVACRV